MADLLLYSRFADWWPLMSPPAHYVEEAADLIPTLQTAPDSPPVTLLELGCGGGSLAWHLKRHWQLTLTDVSPAMLAVSREVNPECAHVLGDMRTIDLGRTFDLVLIHDAIMYLLSPADVRAALATAARHCRPGGGIAVLPDCVQETLAASLDEVDTGGEDAPDGRGLRYMEWSWDADPGDTEFTTTYAFVLRHADGGVTVEGDVHRNGVFPRADWLAWFDQAGFDVTTRLDPWQRDVFAGRRRTAGGASATS